MRILLKLLIAFGFTIATVIFSYGVIGLFNLANQLSPSYGIPIAGIIVVMIYYYFTIDTLKDKK